MKRVKLIAVVCIFLNASFSFAQKASEELMKVRQSFLASEDFSADVTVTGFVDKSDKAGRAIGSGVMRKTKTEYYSKFGTDEMMYNSRCVVLVDHSDKSIIYIPESGFANFQKKQPVPDLDSLLSMNDSVLYRGIQNGMKVFSFYNRRTIVYRTELFVDAQSLSVKKLIYYYKEADEEDNFSMDHVVIDYKNIQTKITDKNIFSEKKYFASLKGKPVTSEEYKKYKVTVLHNEKPN